MLRSCALGVALIALLTAGNARAAGANEDEREVAASGNEDAKKRFAEGNERYARGEYEAAVESFRAAIAAEPKLPGPYRNLGLAYRALGRCADALPAYEKYLALKPESRFTERVKKEIDLCRTKLGQVKAQPAQPVATPTPPPPPPQPAGQTAHPETAQGILHVAANLIGGEATDEATVKVDGLVRGATPMTIPVTAGVHKIDLARMGFESASTTVEVGPGERRDVELTINKLQQAAIVPIVSPTGSSQSTVPAATDEPTGPRKSYAKYGWIILGVAAVTGAVGAGFGIAESRLHRDAVAADPSTTSRSYVDDKRHTGQIYGDVAEAGLAVGGAALLAGAIILIVDPSRGETHETQKYVIAPAVDRNGGSLVATVRF